VVSLTALVVLTEKLDVDDDIEMTIAPARRSLGGAPPTQVPAEQDEPPVQMRPQVPQLLLSFCGLMQRPPQRTWPVGQAQAPLVQVWPPVQTRPHMPQLLLAVSRLTQAPEQAVWPDGHAHAPLVQAWPPRK
jgi:hypothetical protein